MAKNNIVLEGRFKGRDVILIKEYIKIGGRDIKNRISSYTVIDETSKDQYSFWRGALGVALLGGGGAVVGIGGKQKEYLIAIDWNDYPEHSEGNKSLICIDEKHYKAFIQSMF
ncbi:MAG: hypothetical protein NC100_13030 [Clostridium sp.]|nr:hypothetical protein [Clostridium sp.]